MDIGGAFDAMVNAVRNEAATGSAATRSRPSTSRCGTSRPGCSQLPLHRLLGAVRDAVPVYGSGGFTTYDERRLATAHRVAHEQRIPRVKIKIGEAWGTCVDRDLARMRQARARSETPSSCTSTPTAATPQAGRPRAGYAADLDVRWFEEPVSSDDLDGLR